MSSQLNNPACKIYVGNLGPGVSAAELQMLFSKFGSVRWADIATEPGSTASKGFGFVMMASEPEARKAVIGLDGTRQFGAML
ncbi:MAG TPA: RNA-binding protein, partial [Tepidisphaeraceae bacterium]|nr:RNA-binding protein [Tepidisphaeraceae bacterium]